MVLDYRATVMQILSRNIANDTMPLFTIEGIDGCGKTTIIARLASRLKDMNPLITKEPGATTQGAIIREILFNKTSPDPISEALLFTADHAFHVDYFIRPALKENRVVISDRYVDSRYAYQKVRLSGCLQDPVRWLDCLHREWSIVPDKVYLIDIPVDVALHRIKNSKRNSLTHLEKKSILEQVRENFLRRARRNSRYLIIDGEQTSDDIVSIIESDIRTFIVKN